MGNATTEANILIMTCFARQKIHLSPFKMSLNSEVESLNVLEFCPDKTLRTLLLLSGNSLCFMAVVYLCFRLALDLVLPSSSTPSYHGSCRGRTWICGRVKRSASSTPPVRYLSTNYSRNLSPKLLPCLWMVIV